MLPSIPSAKTPLALVTTLAVLSVAATAEAHGVSSKDARYLLSLDGPAVLPLMYLGAKHMVTGYDHLLFLVGVVFFLRRLRDVVFSVSLFTLGHSLTLLGGVLGGVRANPFLVDAVIGLSVVYKAFENLGGFRALGLEPNTRVVVFGFGLAHGFGLATKLQEVALPRQGLVANILGFNGGVEVGQCLALAAVVLMLGHWRLRPGFLRHACVTNAALMTAGFVLTGYQLTGYLVGVR